MRAEFTVEPFNSGTPGTHVLAAVDAARSLGLDPEVGPFATAIVGDAAQVADAIRALTLAAFSAGATRVSVTVERD
jgi:uncharacterized protein YqgV (UPF0045/DUF77 family)